MNQTDLTLDHVKQIFQMYEDAFGKTMMGITEGDGEATEVFNLIKSQGWTARRYGSRYSPNSKLRFDVYPGGKINVDFEPNTDPRRSVPKEALESEKKFEMKVEEYLRSNSP